MKPIPILGTVVLIGAVLQVILGFEAANDVEAVRGIHILFGIVGLVLVLILTVIAYKAKAATIYSKLTITLLTIVILAQVVLGFQLLNGAEALVVSHEANGFVIVILSLLTGGITFWSAKRQIRT